MEWKEPLVASKEHTIDYFDNSYMWSFAEGNPTSAFTGELVRVYFTGRYDGWCGWVKAGENRSTSNWNDVYNGVNNEDPYTFTMPDYDIDLVFEG